MLKSKESVCYKERLRSHHDALTPLHVLVKPAANFADRLYNMSLDERPRTIYLHVPFCTHNCTFCNLNRRRTQPPDDYANLLLQEIETYSTYPYISEGRYDAVYFGGGTPTTLSAKALQKVLNALRSHLNLTPNVEVTIETTISDLKEDKITVFQEEGVNRFSLGVQTFSFKGRHLLGRWGNGEKAMKKITYLIEKGFQDVSIDLIYNWPGQSEEDLLEDLRIIESLNLAGLSLYALILPKETVLYRMIGTGQCPAIGDIGQEKRFFDLILKRLLDRGFILHELTKLVKPNRDEYKYVRIRYDNGDTLALGAGAGGRLGNVVYHNPSNMDDYRQQVKSPIGLPTKGLLVNNTYDFIYHIVGRLEFGRLDWSDLKPFSKLQDYLQPLIDTLTANGLIKLDSQGLSLNKNGVFWGNNIAWEFATTIIEFFRRKEYLKSQEQNRNEF